ncbi:MAG: winged helix-turn-helix transcriptional regulator [Actinobacteria bacterium]|jgi:DNA-binding transcriptional ArsR family regulator|nr:MAG: winged helix-turn-helix transcriptional regulator [Actinomycetota bacterium]
MARAATTTDAFNAVAEPRRREILDALAGGERAVNDLVHELGVAQPQVSKHLRVLREVGAVDVREDGRRRLYRLNGAALKPIHDWVKEYEQTWSERFDLMDVVLDELKEKEEGDDSVE